MFRPFSSIACLALLVGLCPNLIAFAVPQDAASEKRERQLQQLLTLYPDADANKDGKLTPEEARDRLPDADANKDGKLTPVEARDYWVDPPVVDGRLRRTLHRVEKSPP